jgi:hypothetical protein
VLALGLDASPLAIRLARGRGAPVHHGSVFDAVPGAGRWASALLLDGSIGIGGAPVRLLRRVHELLHPGGRAIVELEPPGAPTRVTRAALAFRGRPSGTEIPWALAGVDRIDAIATAAGFTPVTSWREDDRWFAELC